MFATHPYSQLIKNLLSDYATYKPAYGDIESKVIFDDEHGRYTLLEVGWEDAHYVNGSIIHILRRLRVRGTDQLLVGMTESVLVSATHAPGHRTTHADGTRTRRGSFSVTCPT